MLDRLTGTIMHVDFGDCFEIAMDRCGALLVMRVRSHTGSTKYPEKVPFRLTRMLIRAMEVRVRPASRHSSCPLAAQQH